MVRGVDSDYIDLSLMGTFDMGINFDGFEENVKKFMEVVLPSHNLMFNMIVSILFLYADTLA